MKKILVMLALVSGLAGAAQAQLLRYENFQATSGHESGAVFASFEASTNNWVVGYTTSENPLTVNSDLSYGGLADSSGNGSINLNNPTDTDRGRASMAGWTSVDTGGYYMSFLLRVTDFSGINTAWTTGSSIAGLRSTYNNNIIGLRSDGAGGGFLMISYGTSDMALGPTDPDNSAEIALAANTTYLVVVGAPDVTVSDDGFQLWLNPVSLGGAAPAATTAADWRNTTGTQTAMAFGNDNNVAGTPIWTGVNVDELRIGTTYASVTPAGGPAYTLTVNANPGGSATGGGVYAGGANPQITAVPGNEYVFVSWTGAVSSVNSTTNVLMDADKTVWANFRPAAIKATTFVIE